MIDVRGNYAVRICRGHFEADAGCEIHNQQKKWREYLTIGETQTVSAALLPKIFLLSMEKNNDIGMSMNIQEKKRLQEMLFYSEIDVM